MSIRRLQNLTSVKPDVVTALAAVQREFDNIYRNLPTLHLTVDEDAGLTLSDNEISAVTANSNRQGMLSAEDYARFDEAADAIISSGNVTAEERANWNSAYAHALDVTGNVHGATSANTASMIVRRGSSGQIETGEITVYGSTLKLTAAPSVEKRVFFEHDGWTNWSVRLPASANRLSIGEGANEYLVVESGGNVGISVGNVTLSDTKMLQIAQSSGNTVYFSGNGTELLIRGGSTGTRFRNNADSANTFTLSDTGTAFFAGNVGIGTAPAGGYSISASEIIYTQSSFRTGNFYIDAAATGDARLWNYGTNKGLDFRANGTGTYEIGYNTGAGGGALTYWGGLITAAVKLWPTGTIETWYNGTQGPTLSAQYNRLYVGQTEYCGGSIIQQAGNFYIGTNAASSWVGTYATGGFMVWQTGGWAQLFYVENNTGNAYLGDPAGVASNVRFTISGGHGSNLGGVVKMQETGASASSVSLGVCNAIVAGDTGTRDLYLQALGADLRIGSDEDRIIRFVENSWANSIVTISSGGMAAYKTIGLTYADAQLSIMATNDNGISSLMVYTHDYRNGFFKVYDQYNLVQIGGGTGMNMTLRLDTSDMIYMNSTGGSVYNELEQSTRLADSKYIGSPSFISGYFGCGWKLDHNLSLINASYLEIDNIVVRGTLRTHIFQKDIIRATNGYLFISDATEVSADATLNDTGNTDLYLKENVFLMNDLCWYKEANMDTGNVTSAQVIIDSDGVWTQIPGSSKYAYKFSAYLYSPSGATLKAGGTIVRVGHQGGGAGREGSIYFDASSPSYAPFMDIYDGVTDWSEFMAFAKLKARLGKLTGITDTDFGGALTGYGIYTGQGYFKGNIVVKSAVSQALAASSIAIGKITGTAANAIKITNGTGDTSTDGFFAYGAGSVLVFALRMNSTAQIAAWSFDNAKLYNGTDIVLDGNAKKVSVAADKVKMYYTSSTDWGILGKDNSSNTVFQLGYVNKIAGWTFTDRSITSGISNKYLELYSQANTQSCIRAYDTNAYCMVGMGEGYWNNGWQQEFGFWLTPNFQSGSPYVQFTRSLTGSPWTLTAKIAGWYFNSTAIFNTQDIANASVIISTNGDAGTGTRVIFGKYDASYYGIRCWDGTNTYFVLSSNSASNQIAGFKFTNTYIEEPNGDWRLSSSGGMLYDCTLSQVGRNSLNWMSNDLVTTLYGRIGVGSSAGAPNWMNVKVQNVSGGISMQLESGDVWEVNIADGAVGTGKFGRVEKQVYNYISNTDGTYPMYLSGYNDGTNQIALYLDYKGSASTFVSRSDERMKHSIVTIDNALEKVRKLRGVYFRFRDRWDDGRQHVGMIGQEVQQVFPELITVEQNGMLSLEYQSLVAPLVESIKELADRVERLEG